MRRAMPRVAAAIGLCSLLSGCGLTTSHGLEDIDPQSLPNQLIATRPPTPSPSSAPMSRGGTVYFVGEDRLIGRPRTLNAPPGLAAVQELLDALTAGPTGSDRGEGISTALPPTTVLRLAGVEGEIATVDLSVAQLPPDQTAAIAQIVLTVTSLAEVNGLRLTVNGDPISAPLASGAQTDRPLTRADYAPMLAAES